jgi:DNA-binding transcriptional LysR family regulator
VLKTTLLPKLAPLLREYPDIHIEFDANHGFRDIVADRFVNTLMLRQIMRRFRHRVSCEIIWRSGCCHAQFRAGGELKVRVNGQLTFNTSDHVVDAALAGLGIAFLPSCAAHQQRVRRLGKAVCGWDNKDSSPEKDDTRTQARFSSYYRY